MGSCSAYGAEADLVLEHSRELSEFFLTRMTLDKYSAHKLDRFSSGDE